MATTKAKASKRNSNKREEYSLAQRTICNGNIVLYFRTDNDTRWHSRIRQQANTWHRFSTKESSFSKAKKVAEERFREIKHNEKHKRVIVPRKFSDVCRVVKRELLKEYERTDERTLNSHIQVIDGYLVPFLGKYKCHEITTKALKEFSKARTNKLGKEPSKSTISNHNSALNYVLKQAQALGYIEKLPKINNEGTLSGTRDWFAEDEWKALRNFMRKDLNNAKKMVGKGGRNGIDTITALTYEIRELVRDVALILVNTGIRSGNEIMSLKWRNLDIVEEGEKQMVQFSLTHTKTMNRTGHLRRVIAYQSRNKTSNKKPYGVWEPLRRIASRFEDTKDLEWEELFEQDIDIFRLPSTNEEVNYDRLGKQFVTLLKRCPYKGRKDGLYRTSNNNTRSLYSLRHTYATFRLKEGMTEGDLSRNMGCSIKMIEEHYGHITPELVPLRYSEKTSKKTDSDSELKQIIKELRKENRELRKDFKELIATLKK